MLHRRSPTRSPTRQHDTGDSLGAHPAGGEPADLPAHLTRRHPHRRQHVAHPHLSSAPQAPQTVTTVHSHQCTRPPRYSVPARRLGTRPAPCAPRRCRVLTDSVTHLPNRVRCHQLQQPGIIRRRRHRAADRGRNVIVKTLQHRRCDVGVGGRRGPHRRVGIPGEPIQQHVEPGAHPASGPSPDLCTHHLVRVSRESRYQQLRQPTRPETARHRTSQPGIAPRRHERRPQRERALGPPRDGLLSLNDIAAGCDSQNRSWSGKVRVSASSPACHTVPVDRLRCARRSAARRIRRPRPMRKRPGARRGRRAHPASVEPVETLTKPALRHPRRRRHVARGELRSVAQSP